MKTNSILAGALFFLILFFSVGARSQAPIYKFKTPTLISGTGGQVNAVYRFPNVNTGVDALVKIQNKVGTITLQNIDRTIDGYDEAFQPEYKIGSASNSYFEFLITFVLAGTNTPVLQPMVDVSALDIDGSTAGALTLKEFNRVDMGGGVCTFNTLGSQLTISQNGTAFDGTNLTGILFGALVDTAAKEVMFSVSNVNVTSFIYRAGANSLLNGQSTRYASLYFKKFNYPQGAVLSVSNLSSFSGVAADSKAKLKWTLTGGNTANNIVLEKSNTGNTFQEIAEFWVNLNGNTQKDFSYADDKGTDGPVYYRLKITSSDGKIQYSNILHFQNQESAVNTLAVYPSLVQSATTINYSSQEKQNAVIFVTDMNGRQVKQQNVLLQEGTNSIQLSGFDRFSKGNYIISVNTARQKSAKQIIVQ
ncbi:MAG: T9SS type A sorting domain-containing protein [Bacteroidota bacterium]|nr:T9SS type A sorting domain-containing protein [Bacteroidota bacterium]